MVKLELGHKDVILCLLDFLREHNMLASMLALERETNLSLFKYSNEITFLRKLILDGAWPQVESLLKAVGAKGNNFDLRKAMFHIKRQIYLEMLAGNSLDKEALQWVVQDLQPYCDEETFTSLCMILSLPKLTDAPQFTDWTVSKGRLSSFQSIRRLFSNIYDAGEKRRAPPERLAKLLTDAVQFQYLAAKQTGSKPQFKFDPVSQASEASLLKDLISAESQAKFVSQTVPELKISFHARAVPSTTFKFNQMTALQTPSQASQQLNLSLSQSVTPSSTNQNQNQTQQVDYQANARHFSPKNTSTNDQGDFSSNSLNSAAQLQQMIQQQQNNLNNQQKQGVFQQDVRGNISMSSTGGPQMSKSREFQNQLQTQTVQQNQLTNNTANVSQLMYMSMHPPARHSKRDGKLSNHAVGGQDEQEIEETDDQQEFERSEAQVRGAQGVQSDASENQIENNYGDQNQFDYGNEDQQPNLTSNLGEGNLAQNNVGVVNQDSESGEEQIEIIDEDDVQIGGGQPGLDDFTTTDQGYDSGANKQLDFLRQSAQNGLSNLGNNQQNAAMMHISYDNFQRKSAAQTNQLNSRQQNRHQQTNTLNQKQEVQMERGRVGEQAHQVNPNLDQLNSGDILSQSMPPPASLQNQHFQNVIAQRPYVQLDMPSNSGVSGTGNQNTQATGDKRRNQVQNNRQMYRPTQQNTQQQPLPSSNSQVLAAGKFTSAARVMMPNQQQVVQNFAQQQNQVPKIQNQNSSEIAKRGSSDNYPQAAAQQQVQANFFHPSQQVSSENQGQQNTSAQLDQVLLQNSLSMSQENSQMMNMAQHNITTNVQKGVGTGQPVMSLGDNQPQLTVIQQESSANGPQNPNKIPQNQQNSANISQNQHPSNSVDQQINPEMAQQIQNVQNQNGQQFKAGGSRKPQYHHQRKNSNSSYSNLPNSLTPMQQQLALKQAHQQMNNSSSSNAGQIQQNPNQSQIPPLHKQFQQQQQTHQGMVQVIDSAGDELNSSDQVEDEGERQEEVEVDTDQQTQNVESQSNQQSEVHQNQFSQQQFLNHKQNTNSQQQQAVVVSSSGQSTVQQQQRRVVGIPPTSPQEEANTTNTVQSQSEQAVGASLGFGGAQSQSEQTTAQNNSGAEDLNQPPMQIISDIEPMIDSTVNHMQELAILRDNQPIRASCFSPSGDYFVLGTNSKALKICTLPQLTQGEEETDADEQQQFQQEQIGSQRQEANGKVQDAGIQQINVVLDQSNHHVGSLYCVDWSRTERLIATGSNDRQIKLMVCPDLQQEQHDDILEMTLQGHQAIVRTVCFDPTNDLVLLSGGQIDQDVKVWNSETGINVANLSGHQGDIHSIKMAQDGSFAISVSTDKQIMLFDIRCAKAVCKIDASEYPEMHDVALSSQQGGIDTTNQQQQQMRGADMSNNLSGSLNGFASIGHSDGSISIWNLYMRQCFAFQKIHSQQVRGVSYSVDGYFVASAGYDHQVHISDTVNLEAVQVVKTLEHEDKVVSVKWHPYLPLLLSTSADKTARIWYPQNSRV